MTRNPITINCRIPSPDVFRSVLNDLVMESLLEELSAREEWIKSFLMKKYGVTTPEECSVIVKTKHLSLCYGPQDIFLGIIANNRWLYTLEGKTIGKKGGRFDIASLVNDRLSVAIKE